MAIGHHNAGMYLYYMEVFKHLAIHLSDHLASYLQCRNAHKNWKKEYDSNPKNKARRKWKFDVKDKEALLKEATRGPKEGTYETGVAMKSSQAEGTGGEPRKRKRIERGWCDCGGKVPHKNKNSKHCIAPKKKKTDVAPPNDTSS